MSKQVIATILATLTLMACQSVAPPRLATSLVEARLLQVENVTGQSGSPSSCTTDGFICIDGAYRLSFTVNRNFVGPTVPHSLSLTQTSAMPIAGRNYLLVVQDSEDGPTVVWSGLAANGLCLERNEATRYGLAERLAQFPCRSKRLLSTQTTH